LRREYRSDRDARYHRRDQGRRQPAPLRLVGIILLAGALGALSVRSTTTIQRGTCQ
jgi:hypothetical protein